MMSMVLGKSGVRWSFLLAGALIATRGLFALTLSDVKWKSIHI